MSTNYDCLPDGQQAQPMPDPAAASNAPTLRAKAGFADLAKALLCEYDVEQLAELDPTLYDQFIGQLERRCGLCLRD